MHIANPDCAPLTPALRCSGSQRLLAKSPNLPVVRTKDGPYAMVG